VIKRDKLRIIVGNFTLRSPQNIFRKEEEEEEEEEE
jgi:hypothetical protein